MSVNTVRRIPWRKEPSREQSLGWTLAAFDSTVFLLILLPISQEFHVPMTELALVLSVTVWMQLLGAVSSGWLADRIGRKTLLIISILGYSVCNFIAGFSSAFWFLFLLRALLGIFVGAEWPAGAVLAMEVWPARSRGVMSGVLQGSWAIGLLLSGGIYGLCYSSIGWRGMLWIGILPALLVIFVRFSVKESVIWVENRRLQRDQHREVRAPLIRIFKRGMLANTLTTCWWTLSSSVVYYSTLGLFATHLQKDLHLSPAVLVVPTLISNLVSLFGMGFWGWTADRLGRRWAMIIPALIAIPVAPVYLFTRDPLWMMMGFVLQGAFGGALASQYPSYLSERFHTEVRATATAFCSQQGAFLTGFLVVPVLTYLATSYNLSVATSMLVGICVGVTSLVIARSLAPKPRARSSKPSF
jgi:MFS transporter, SHS family, lactate transporter